jgi:hypothetical protein
MQRILVLLFFCSLLSAECEQALANVYGMILEFCMAAASMFLTKDGKLKSTCLYYPRRSGAANVRSDRWSKAFRTVIMGTV